MNKWSNNILIRIIYDHNWVIKYMKIQNGCLKIVQLPNIPKTSHKVQPNRHLHISAHIGLEYLNVQSYCKLVMAYSHIHTKLFILNPRWPTFRFVIF